MPRPAIVRSARTTVVLALVALLATAAVPDWVRVQRGDTLWELARKYGTTVQALKELNGIGGNNVIYAGQKLRIGRVPVVTSAKPAKAAPPTVRKQPIFHKVVRGDSLIRIARRYSASPDWIARRNKLPRSRVVILGQRLVVGERTVLVKPAAPAAPQRVSKARARALVVAEARRAGVDPHLAVALALQESGLQQHVVSSVGALGIMQVMPGTGAWVARHLVKRPLNLRVAEDNVVAGVRYLALLLKITKSRQEALAGYYQGLASVRSRGMYDDTKRYVKNVLAIRDRVASRR